MNSRVKRHTTLSWRVLTRALTSALLALHPTTLLSQSDLAAWAGLVLSPAGALPPLASGAADSLSRRDAVTVRYGYWRYDIDDAVHNNIGLTFSHRVGSGRTDLALTGAYLTLQCDGCSPWLLGGMELESTLWHSVFSGASTPALGASIGMRAAIGGARNAGMEHATAGGVSVAAALGLDGALGHSRWSVVLLPGLGIGRLASADLTGQGARVMYGAAAGLLLPSGIAADVGMQRVYIAGGPTQYGVTLTWRLP